MPIRLDSVRWTWVLIGALLTTSLSLNVILLSNYIYRGFQLAHCRSTIQVFESVTGDSLKEVDIREIRAKMTYIKNHYTSGTIQDPGSHLEYILETARQNALDQIQAHLDKLEKK